MPESDSPTLLGYAEMVWRRRLLVILVILTMTGAAVAVSMSQTKIYNATAELSLARQLLDSSFNVQVVELSDRQMETQIATLRGRDVAELARAGGATYPIAATAASTSNLVSISARGPDPVQAARTADAYAQAFVDHTAQQAQQTVDLATAALQERIDLLQTRIDPLVEEIRGAPADARADVQVSVGPVLAGLQQQQAGVQADLGGLQLRRAVAGDDVTIVQGATVPVLPVSPKPLQDGLFAAVLALALAVSTAILLELRRRRLLLSRAAHSRDAEHLRLDALPRRIHPPLAAPVQAPPLEIPGRAVVRPHPRIDGSTSRPLGGREDARPPGQSLWR